MLVPVPVPVPAWKRALWRLTASDGDCRFLLADAKGRFGGVVKATAHAVPTGLLAQEEPEVEAPPLHLPRIPHAAGALANHSELMDQLGSEARGSLEVQELSQLFTGIEAAHAPQGHAFTTQWSEDALRSSGFDPTPPPPKAARPTASSSSAGTAAARPGSGGQASVTSGGSFGGHATLKAKPRTALKSDAHAPASAGAVQQASHRQPRDELRPGSSSSQGRGGTQGSGDGDRAAAGGGKGAESAGGAPRETLRWDESQVAPVMRHLEERTHLEIAALDAEFASIMACGDGALSARGRLETFRSSLPVPPPLFPSLFLSKG